VEWWLKRTYDDIAGDLPVRHWVCGGIYTRELFIPAGVTLTGKIHGRDHMCALLQGDLSVMGDRGMMRIQPPFACESKAGAKRVGHAHEDCVFATFHRTDLTDIDAIEDELFGDSDLSWIDKTGLFDGGENIMNTECKRVDK
jgi:hypothetical protein